MKGEQFGCLITNLYREFPRGRNDQDSNVFAQRMVAADEQPLEGWDEECEGLTRPCLGLTENVSAGYGCGECFGLDFHQGFEFEDFFEGASGFGVYVDNVLEFDVGEKTGILDRGGVVFDILKVKK